MFSFKDLFRKEKSAHPPIILPESVRYALTYNGGRLKKDEVLSMLERSVFGFASVYCGLKFLAPHTHLLERGIELFSFSLSKRIDQDDLNKKLAELVEQVEDHDVGAKKIAEFSRYDFEVYSGFEDIAQRIISQELTPVILAYAGLCAAPSLINAGSEEYYILIDDKKFHKDITFLRIYKQGDIWKATPFDAQGFKGDLALIDDAKRTGETFSSAQFALRQAGFENQIVEFCRVDQSQK